MLSNYQILTVYETTSHDESRCVSARIFSKEQMFLKSGKDRVVQSRLLRSTLGRVKLFSEVKLPLQTDETVEACFLVLFWLPKYNTQNVYAHSRIIICTTIIFKKCTIL